MVIPKNNLPDCSIYLPENIPQIFKFPCLTSQTIPLYPFSPKYRKILSSKQNILLTNSSEETRL
ncbi:MAG: hypothetical protein RL368_752 [Pseudomonadota bacterium]